MTALPTLRKPQTGTPSAAPRRPHTTPLPGPAPVPTGAQLLATPTWSQRLLPRPLRNQLAALGWWTNPTPAPPSLHLQHIHQVLTHYGWSQSLDVSPTGRMCIRGAQTCLERAGHVTPADRDRAVGHMQTALTARGVRMPFFAWNDLPTTTFPQVTGLLINAAYRARANGE
ncbi:hypothetical protein [Streptomyces sp. NEAU-H3]|uniref:DUF6197 family protein n=1 Tax=Streptomyces sp. NEAU-H3 TaxID=2720636 RepID=UPI00280BC413|nr:hypothetical protein [Streptomyces sp. NEAU-H3]